MNIHAAIEEEIKLKVQAGVLPSVVFRELLSEYADLNKHDLGSHFRVSFPNVDGVVWNVVAHWEIKRNSDDFDMRMNVGLINELIKANYSVIWTLDWLEKQWERIKPIVVQSKTGNEEK